MPRGKNTGWEGDIKERVFKRNCPGGKKGGETGQAPETDLENQE